MKRILVPFTSAGNGGSQLSFFRLARLLRDEYRFHLWFFGDGPFVAMVRDAGIAHERLPYSRLRSPWGYAVLKRELYLLRPDHVYLHSSRIIAMAARSLGIPCTEKINMSRTAGAGGWSRFASIDRYFSNLNTRLVVVSEALKRQMVERGVPEDKIESLCTFVDEERFRRRSEARRRVRAELAIPEGAVAVLNVGRMVPQKAQGDLVEVARSVCREDGRLHFVIVGQGPLEGALRRQVRDCGLDARFRFVPFRDDIENVYSACDLLVHSARWEPLANCLLEARCVGLAIVASDVDGSREALEGYPCASLVRPGDVRGFSESVLAWRRRGTCPSPPPLPEKFTPAGARARFRELFG